MCSFFLFTYPCHKGLFKGGTSWFPSSGRMNKDNKFLPCGVIRLDKGLSKILKHSSNLCRTKRPQVFFTTVSCSNNRVTISTQWRPDFQTARSHLDLQSVWLMQQLLETQCQTNVVALDYITVLCCHSLFDLRNKTLSSFHREKQWEGKGQQANTVTSLTGGGHTACLSFILQRQDFAPGGEPLNYIFNAFKQDIDMLDITGSRSAHVKGLLCLTNVTWLEHN